ncbi:sorting nexin 2A [Micractinium conductrix]|uniref:Sorting nexin 2A n=1 Tax=Micractinium conductrix TaxID=554055 RepID=A0A2P6V281_9CHLO|nr:sorting nexin 2A [Micractinium conductrix]|eukprot:PSC68192.1 sorting nexin 2A [Micractinium conductrix]
MRISAGNAREQPGYHDLYQQQAAAQQRPVPVPAAAALGGASLSPAPPRHRHADSLTLDGLSEIGGEEDAGYLYSGGALGGGGASGSGGGAAFGPSGGGAGGSSASTRPPPALELWVTDPVRRIGDSVIPGFTSTHYEYLVASSSEGARGRRRVEVRRRFKDFVALADLLAITQRGYFVFPRPDKNTLDQQLGKSDFVESRRAELERYLRKLAAHPVVGRCEELRVFLETEGNLAGSFPWQQLQPLRGSLLEGIGRLPRQLIGSDSSVPSTVEAQQNARNTSDLLRRFRELGERMRQEYKEPPVLGEQEARLRERRAGVEEYAEKLAVASRRAEALVKEFEEMGAVIGDLGLSLVKLGKFEEEEGAKCGRYTELGVGAAAVAADARRAGLAAVRHSRLARAANAQSMEALEPLHDELAMSPAVVAALREREAALLTAQSIEEDLDKRRRAAGQLEEAGARRVGGDAAKARKVAALQNDVAALEAALEAAKQEYGRVTERNLQELERSRQERSSEFARLVRGLAEVNALYGQRCLDIWRGVGEDFGAHAQLDAQQRQ